VPEHPCFHCGTPCRAPALARHDKAFCCQGCLAVFELLAENGLTDFYRLGDNAGVRVRNAASEDQYHFLDEPNLRSRLADFSDERITQVTFRIPAIHCIACVWLLENLFRLKPGIGRSRVDFPRKEVAVSFENERVTLGGVAALLASLGYEPELKFSDLDRTPRSPVSRRLWLQLGVAAFAFGNIMLFSIASYLGLDQFSGPAFRRLFGYLSLGLALPVFFYSAADYWRSAWMSIRHRTLTIDVPIAAGILALFAQSLYEILSGRGEGYLDSLAGLLFFLLCGRLFQHKTFHRLAFDRDYKSFFPLSVTRKTAEGEAPAPGHPRGAPSDPPESNPGAPGEERVSLSRLQVGDTLILRNGELIPADSVLVEGPALIDYSFVTGESEPAARKPGEHLYAGGRQLGAKIEARIVKPVSQSYLTSLWNQEAFRKDGPAAFDTLTNRYSRLFTRLVIAIAIAAAVFWSFRDPDRALKSFVSVLIVACPCALALAAPFALGTAQRALARRNVFLKSPHVLETLARADAVVFDKTGTLTAAGAGSVSFHGPPLSALEESRFASLTGHSTHPCAVRIAEAIAGNHLAEAVRSFRETPGCGIEGSVAGHEIWMGSATWLESRGTQVESPTIATHLYPSSPQEDRAEHASHSSQSPSSTPPRGSDVHVAIDGRYRGCFVLAGELRPHTGRLLEELSSRYELALLSGDNDKERDRFSPWFSRARTLHFNQSPLDKLDFIRRLQLSGRTVVMVGDGLNDAGALKQSDAGVAVVENVNAFSPASDVILSAALVPRLADVLGFARASVRVVRLSFLVSTAYNVAGISIAARGLLSPLACAILMPLSSVTVVTFACGLTSWLARRRFGPGPVAANATPRTANVEPDAAPAFDKDTASLARPTAQRSSAERAGVRAALAQCFTRKTKGGGGTRSLLRATRPPGPNIPQPSLPQEASR
jgi:Cu+-exporting ATPase